MIDILNNEIAYTLDQKAKRVESFEIMFILLKVLLKSFQPNMTLRRKNLAQKAETEAINLNSIWLDFRLLDRLKN